jgi:hypothetical protein
MFYDQESIVLVGRCTKYVEILAHAPVMTSHRIHNAGDSVWRAAIVLKGKP